MTLVVCTDHGTPLPGAVGDAYDVVGVKGLCSDPSNLTDAGVTNPEALILHVDEYDLCFIQGAIRRSGVDPLGVPVEALAGMPTEAGLRTLGAGSIARHRAFPGTGPENAKLRWPELLSRRRMFALHAPQYIAAPSIDPALCSATHGCRLCVESCPMQALEPSGGAISFSIESCVACGICVTTCPTGATTNPAATPHQVAAAVAAMVESATEPIGIRFHCRDARPRAISGDWYPVEVPCTGMLSIGWLLAPLLLGAAAVSVGPCTGSGCPLGNDDRVSDRCAMAAAICSELGFGGERIRLSREGEMTEPLGSMPVTAIADMHDADMFLAMAGLASVDDFASATPVGAAGVVTIDEHACTLCEQCTSVCPTGALKVHRPDEAIEITFDSAMCVGCSMCIATCPERAKGAIGLDRRFDVAELMAGRHRVVGGSTAVCEACGGPIASSAMLERIRSMLGQDHAGTIDLIGRRCTDCR